MNAIFTHRQEKGFSVHQLAAASGVPLLRLRRLESGKELPTADELRFLGRALEVEPEELLDFEED
ncbi:MAG TPA: helix-turn-helix transcriptional regulator [Acidobacteriota bacterium]